MFERSDVFTIIRLKPHAKAIRRLGTLFFLLAIAGLIVPIVFAQFLIVSMFASADGNLVPLIYLGVEAILIILAFTFWISSVKGQKGTLTVLWDKLSFKFKKKSFSIDYDDIQSVNASYKKGLYRVKYTNQAKKDKWFPTLKAHESFEFKSKSIIDIETSINDARSEYREYREKSEEEWQQRLSGHYSSKSE